MDTSTRYEFKLKVGNEKEADKCVKIFLNSMEVKTLDFVSLMERILERVPSLRGKEVSLKYLDDREDWIDLPVQDLDSFIDMIETARASTRENLKVIQLKVNELAITPQHGAKHCVSQKRSRNSVSLSKIYREFTLG